MRTLAVLLFIAGAAAVAILLARKPTVVDGRVMEAEFLALYRPQGVTSMACDRAIPIGRRGAVFACTATLRSGATQLLDCTMDRDGKLTANPAGANLAGDTRPAISPRSAPNPGPEPDLAADPGPGPDLAADPGPGPDLAADPGPGPDPGSAADPAADPAAAPHLEEEPRPAGSARHDGIRPSGDPWGN